MPPVDRDESRFAQASRQVMLAAVEGDAEGTLVPKVQDRPRLNKPPLIYWLQAVPAWFADRDPAGADPRLQRIGWYRLPSVVCAILAVLATWRAGCLFYRGREGAIAGATLAVCPMVLWDAHQARADQLLLACTTGALLALAHIWNARRSGARVTIARSLSLWGCVGLGVLAKGPITPMVVVLALGALWILGAGWSSVRATRPLLGVGIVSAMVVPWVVAVASCVGWGEYLSIIFNETIGRAGTAKESHWGPPGYHLLLLPALLFPGSLVTLVALRRACRRTRRSGRFVWTSPEALLLAWVVPSWVVFEGVMTKLPHYTLVLYPALALLGARALTVVVRARRRIDMTGVVIWTLIGLGLCAAPLALTEVFDPAPAVFTRATIGLVSLVCLYLVIDGAASALRGRTDRALFGAGLATLAIGATIFMGPLSLLRRPWVSSSVASVLAEVDPEGERPLARTGYHEDSLVFLTRGRAERVGRNRLQRWIDEHPRGLVVFAPSDEQGVPAWARPLAEVEGFNYSTGERVRVVVMERRRRTAGPVRGRAMERADGRRLPADREPR
ncbi:MAG: glycosyltransferase family 39 protein [Planctomycetota bacterium]